MRGATIKALSFACGILVLAGFGCASRLAVGVSEEMDAYTDKLVAAPGAGLALCVFDGQGLLWSRYEGMADAEEGAAFGPDTVLNLGGLSGQFTILAALRLVEAGTLDPDAKIGVYAPELFASGSPGGSLTGAAGLRLDSLLYQTTGWQAGSVGIGGLHTGIAGLAAYLDAARPSYPEGARYSPSTAMIDLLGAIVEKTEGRPFAECVRRLVFDPLGMGMSGFGPEDSAPTPAMFYHGSPEDPYPRGFLVKAPVVEPSYSMRASILDLVSAYSALLAAFDGDGKLSSRTALAAVEPRATIPGILGKGRLGAGWHIGEASLEHLGGIAWAEGAYLSHKVAVVLAYNTGLGAIVAGNMFMDDSSQALKPAESLLAFYAEKTLGLERPIFSPPTVKPLPAGFAKERAGLYACDEGLVSLRFDGDTAILEGEGDFIRLVYDGESGLLPTTASRLASVGFEGPDRLRVSSRDGTVVIASRAVEDGSGFARAVRERAYACDDTAASLRSFSIVKLGGVALVEENDGRRFLLVPRSASQAEALCDETSVLFHRPMTLMEDGTILFDGLRYHGN